MSMRSLLLAGAATMAMAAAGHAATSGPFSDSVTAPTDLVDVVLSLPQFDPSLGTLASIDWEFEGSIVGTIQLTNNNQTSSLVSASTQSTFFFSGPGGQPLANFSVSGSTGPQNLAAGESSVFPVSGSDSLSGTLGPLAAFIGLGTLDVTVSTLTGILISGGGGNIASVQVTDATALFRLTYNYEEDVDVIPLPAAGWLLLTALGGLAVAGRRRKAA